MPTKPSFPSVLFLILITVSISIGFVTGCGDDDDPVGPTPPTVDPYSLGMARTDWSLASVPNPLKNDDDWTRGTIRWHNPPPISREEVFSYETEAGDGALYPLRLIFRPRGLEATGPSYDPCFFWYSTKSWGGIMRLWSAGLPPSNAGEQHWLQLRVKPTGGILHFEFGRINEDVDGDGTMDDEDRSNPRNRTLDEGEDTGLDHLIDEDELGRCLEPYDATTNPDPAGDNWWYEGYGKGVGEPGYSRPPVPENLWNDPDYQNSVNDLDHWRHYEWQNGTEGNVYDDAFRGLPDHEDPAYDGLNTLDAYLSYEIQLDTGGANPYLVTGSELNGWYTFRIPISGGADPDIIRSEPGLEVDWRYVTHVRIWFEQPEYNTDSLQDMDSLWIADWRLVSW